MLDQVVVPATVDAGMGQHLQNRVDLMETRKDQRFFAVRAVEVEKPPDNIQKDVAGENRPPFGLIGPEIGDAKLPVDIRVARAAVMPAIEGKEPGLSVLEAGGHGHVVLIHREMDQGPSLECQQRLIGGRPVMAILPFGMTEILAGQGILQFQRRHR